MYKISVMYEVLKKEGAIFARISCSDCDTNYDRRILYNEEMKRYTDRLRTEKYCCNKMDIIDLKDKVITILDIAEQYIKDRRNAECFSKELYQIEDKEYEF